MLQAIKYCHDQNIVHRDVKLENFLVAIDKHLDINVKLADFGLACKYDWEAPPTQKCGTLLSVSPELLSQKTYCHKVDLWGIGVIMYELLCTEIPFYADDQKQYMENILKDELKFVDSELWQQVSNQAKDLVSRLLDKNPSTRISATEALKHPWFKKMYTNY